MKVYFSGERCLSVSMCVFIETTACTELTKDWLQRHEPVQKLKSIARPTQHSIRRNVVCVSIFPRPRPFLDVRWNVGYPCLYFGTHTHPMRHPDAWLGITLEK